MLGLREAFRTIDWRAIKEELKIFQIQNQLYF